VAAQSAWAGLGTRFRAGGVQLGLASFAAAGVAAWVALPMPLAGSVVDIAGRPVSGALVVAGSSEFGQPANALTDAAGRFSLLGRLWPASRTLTIGAPGFMPLRSGGGRTVLHRWPSLTGQVVDDTGAQVPNAWVAVRQGERRWRTEADSTGRFKLTIPLAKGPADVDVEAPLHDPDQEAIGLGLDGIVTLQAVVPRQLGTLQLDSDPTGLPVTIDGKPSSGCSTTPCQVKLMVGPHTIGIDSDPWVPWAQSIATEKGQTQAVHPKLVHKTGTLAITAPGGEVSIDGNQVAGGSWTGTLDTGHHTIGYRSASTWPASAGADVQWNQTASVTVGGTAVPVGDAGAFLAGLQAYLGGLGGSYGLYVEELNTGRTLGYGQDSGLEAASVIKLPEALYLLSQVDSGAVKLTDQIDLHPEDFMGGTGILFAQANPGDKFSYQDLLTDLIRYSDNTAWQAMMRVLGAGSIDAYAASLGAGDCHQQSDICTAREAGSLISRLARGQVLSAASNSMLMGLLENTVFNDRINYYLGGVTIAHKIGMDGGVINDCGVVFGPGSPYTICVFTTTDDANKGVQAIRDITRAVNHYLGH
jgi:beta-lactamase class A